MDIEKYNYLWDGSEEGWVLHHTDHVVWKITYLFGSVGPKNKEIQALRKLVPEFKDQNLSFVLSRVKNKDKYAVQYSYGNIEINQLKPALVEMALKYEISSEQIGGYLPVSKDSMALLIEDEELSKAICQKMLEAGVPVICHTHVD